jgi:2-polyprenyl-6-methoxyphenol hydroxylase-like FAD-dependent oxidoreductase
LKGLSLSRRALDIGASPRGFQMARLIVIGAGPAGLGAALFSARRGHSVVLVERDSERPPEDADACFDTWNRRGVGQIRQGHLFLALACRVLLEEAPEVFAEVCEGAFTLPLMEAAPPELPSVLGARRTTFEQALRRHVGRQPDIEILAGATVAGLIARDGERVPHVTGVRLASGEGLEGDLVVDASGRGTHARRWLAAIGARPCPEEHQEVGFSYLTRWYRLKDGAPAPEQPGPPGRQAPYGIFMAAPADRRTFCIMIGLSREDPLGRRMFDPTVFDRVAAEVAVCTPWLKAAEGTTNPQPYANVHNGRRSLVDDEGLVVTGFVLVGDSATHTNPTLGRGTSLALAHAQHLARTAHEAQSGADGFAARFAEWTERNLGVWYESQAAIDAAASVRLRATFTGEAVPRAAYAARAIEALGVASATDQRIAGLFQRLIGVLMTLGDVLAQPGVEAQIEPLLENEGRQFPPCDLTRQRFEQLVMGD